MTSALLQSLLKSTAGLSALLLAGMFLRAKVPLFRKFLVPASVIGGFLGLLLGPEILGQTGVEVISEDWSATWSLLASILVVPMFAGTPLGNFRDRNKKRASGRREVGKITIISGIASGAFGFQVIIGVGIPLLLLQFLPNLNFYNNFGYEIGVAEIARTVGIDRTYLYRIFRQQVGESPKRYLTAFRLRMAAGMLEETSLPVTEVALSCGFKEASLFDRQFRGTYGCTPLQYRNKAKNGMCKRI